MTPRQWQVVTAGLIVALSVLLQFVVISRLPWLGASVVVCAVAGVGMAGGQTFGAVAGFSAGFALDVLPPADGLLGTTALALVVVGAVAGRVRDPRGLAPLQLVGIMAGLATLAAVITLAFTALLSGGVTTSSASLVGLLAYVVATAIAGTVIVPVVGMALRRFGGGRRRRRRLATVAG